MVAKQDDVTPVTNVIANEIDIGNWVEHMSVEQLEVVKEVMTKHWSNGHADHVVKLFAKQHPDLMVLEV